METYPEVPCRGQGSTQMQKPLEADPPHLTSARASTEIPGCTAGLTASHPHACKVLVSTSTRAVSYAISLDGHSQHWVKNEPGTE